MKVTCAAVLLAGMTWLINPQPAQAGQLADLLTSTKAKAVEGKILEAFEDLKEAELVLWRAMPEMALRRTALVTEEPAFYGSYTPKADNTYRPGEPVLIYVEPAGYAILEKDGLYTFSLTADFTLVDGSGQILGGQRDFGRWEMSSRRPVTEFMMFFTFDFSGLTPGDYAIETIIKDTNSDRTLSMTTPITVVQ